MAAFHVGQMVKLVSHTPDGYMPPVGAVGTVLRGADNVGDCSVLFHGYPCPVESTDWEVPSCQLVPAVLAPDLKALEMAVA
jgi:hypothetical protein